ncbi:hypothetical protein [Nocardia cyriacigeorgica]|uniref:hypothetical protein n=1 Tax=Nocardia cyriacigeorgica TaxID=135487 RepID=UPI002453AA78|nr:hypothetical protein [Nocardia cyriacigeorgica]
MNDTPVTSPNGPALVYAFRELGLILAAVVDESGRTLDEIAQILGVDAGRLRAGVADPYRMPAAYLMLLSRMADVDVSTWWADAQDGARFIAAQVRDGVACHRCGRAFRVGSTSRPDGFGEHGQLFRCSGGFGCAESRR